MDIFHDYDVTRMSSLPLGAWGDVDPCMDGWCRNNWAGAPGAIYGKEIADDAILKSHKHLGRASTATVLRFLKRAGEDKANGKLTQ